MIAASEFFRPISSSSKGNCYIVDDGKTKLMLECGISKREMIKAGAMGVDACLITHEHQDHAKSWDKVGDVYCSQGTADALDMRGHKIHIMRHKELVTIGTMSIYPFDVDHDAREPFGFAIYSKVTKQKLLFATDTSFIQYQFLGVTHLAIEANFDDDLIVEMEDAQKHRLIRAHMSIQEAERYILSMNKSELEQVFLLHLSASRSNAINFAKRISKITGLPTTICKE